MEEKKNNGWGGAREGSGRHTTGIPGKTAAITLRISPEEKKLIDERAKKAGKSTTRYMIDLALGN